MCFCGHPFPSCGLTWKASCGCLCLGLVRLVLPKALVFCFSCCERSELLSSGMAETVEGFLFVSLVLIKTQQYLKDKGSKLTLEKYYAELHNSESDFTKITRGVSWAHRKAGLKRTFWLLGSSCLPVLFKYYILIIPSIIHTLSYCSHIFHFPEPLSFQLPSFGMLRIKYVCFSVQQQKARTNLWATYYETKNPSTSLQEAVFK